MKKIIALLVFFIAVAAQSTAHAGSWTEFSTGNILEAAELNANQDYRAEDLLPVSSTGVETDGAYDLGSSTYRWDNAYISGDVKTASTDYYKNYNWNQAGQSGLGGAAQVFTYGRYFIGNFPNTTARLTLPIVLPSGSNLASINVFAYDSDATTSIDMQLLYMNSTGTENQISIDFGTGDAFAGGLITASLGDIDLTVDNSLYSYYLDMNFPNVVTENLFRVYWIQLIFQETGFKALL